MSEKLDKIINWMSEFRDNNKVKGVVLGLSGGKDSTVMAMLAKKVFGDSHCVCSNLWLALYWSHCKRHVFRNTDYGGLFAVCCCGIVA